MSTKPKISANGTYVFDPQEIEQLDELSLTSMLAAIDPSKPPNESRRADPDSLAGAGDTSINALLGEPTLRDEPARTQSDGQAAPEETGDLIAPELIFTELPSRRR